MSKEIKNNLIAVGIVFAVLATVSYLSHIRNAGIKSQRAGIAKSGIANAVYQQDVDHFSNDERAMSPRSWGNYHDTNLNEPVAPQVTFGDKKQPQSNQLQRQPDSNRFQQAEHGSVREPKEFYETQPLELDSNSDGTSKRSSQIPDKPDSPQDLESETSVPTPVTENETEDEIKIEAETQEQVPESRLEPDREATSSPSEIPASSDAQQSAANPQNITHDDFKGYSEFAAASTFDTAVHCHDCGLPIGTRADRRSGSIGLQHSRRGAVPNQCGCGLRQGSPQFGSRNESYDYPKGNGQHGMRGPHGFYQQHGNAQHGCSPNECVAPKYNPGLGHRGPDPILNQFQSSSADNFSFEEDQEYPPMRDILASAVYFSEAEFMYLQPSFSGNTAISATTPTSGVSTPFNFDLEPAFRVMAGFESDFGPGFAGEYFQFDNNSDYSIFTSDGVVNGETRLYQLGPNRWTSLVADDPGETIAAFHSLEVHSTGIYAFKALKFKRAFVNGRFGIQLVSIDQKLEAILLDSGGATLGQLLSNSNLNAFGPQFGIDYVRRIGHTPMQLISSTTTSILFGDRDQTVQNTFTNEFSSIGSDDFLTVIDIFFGVQTKRHRGEKRNTTARIGFVNQSWIGGGTAIDPNGDFGFQGISVMLGFNR